MDFAGPIPYKNSTQNHYILLTVDRLSRFTHAETFNNCDTITALEYLESYCKLHGLPRTIRCDQAQAFKAKEFDIFCKNKNINLKLAPAGGHRGTGMVERLIQTIKRRLAVLDIDPNWSNTALANRLANIIKNIRLIPNTISKMTPFEAHFGRKPNTEISNITTNTSHNYLTYKNLTKYYLDKKLLNQNALTMEEIWRRDGASEDELDIRYRNEEDGDETSSPTTNTQEPTGISVQPKVISSDYSDNLPLIPASPRNKDSPRKIYPSETHFTLGDKTRQTQQKKVIKTRQKIAQKSLHNHLDKKTVIKKNDVAIVTEEKLIPEIPKESQKPKLIHMVACKTISEHKRNQEKIRKFCLEEAKQLKAATNPQPIGEQSSKNPTHGTYELERR